MANASNSTMNIPNTFNLTGTWQNNIDPAFSNNNLNNRGETDGNNTPLQNGQTGQLNVNGSTTIPLNNQTVANSNMPNNASSGNNFRVQNVPLNQNSLPENMVITQRQNSSVPNSLLNQNNNSNSSTIVPGNVVQNGNNSCPSCQNNNNNIPQILDVQNLVNFAKSQIGRNVTIEFLIGENSLIEKSGTIVAVGENYILLNEAGTRNFVACDLKNVKFIYIDY